MQVATELSTAAAQSMFSRLVLAGPSHTRHAVEAALALKVQRGITGLVAKNLAKVPDEDLVAHFPTWTLVL